MKKDINKIKLFLMDMDGTVYLGDQKIDGAFESLDEIRNRNIQICFLTNNSSKSKNTCLKRLKEVYGFNVSENELYTSLNATCEYLNKHYKGKRVFTLATPDVQQELTEKGINLVEDNPDIVLLTFDTTLSYDRLFKFSRFLEQGLPYIATHPDDFCPSSIGKMPDIGAFISMFEHTVNRSPDVIVGKPYSEMANAVMKEYGLSSDEIAMVGDRISTDICFGVNNGFMSILVLTGETTKESLAKSSVKPDIVLDTFADILKLI